MLQDIAKLAAVQQYQLNSAGVRLEKIDALNTDILLSMIRSCRKTLANILYRHICCMQASQAWRHARTAQHHKQTCLGRSPTDSNDV